MPLPLIPLIGAGASLVGGLLGNASQAAQNEEQRKWNEKMYAQQRQDALADWNMQNAYNAPVAQMGRLKEAGLNPNLVYGNGSVVANSQSQPRAASAGSYNPRPMDYSFAGNSLANYFSIRQQQAQIDNLEQQKVLMEQDAKNKAAQEFKIYADTNKSVSQTAGQDIKNQYAPQIAEMSLQGMQASVAKTLTDINATNTRSQIAIEANERAQVQQNMSLKEAAERILNYRQSRLESDARIAKMQVDIAKTQEDRQVAIQRVQQINWQKQEIEERILKIRADTRGSNERNRILRNTPDWSDQRAWGMLEDLIGTFSKPGTRFNPKTFQGWKK